jgi:hypothetical protein
MTGGARLGDFLAAARDQLRQAAATAPTVAPGRDAEEITASLRRIIQTLTAYTADLSGRSWQLADRNWRVLNTTTRAAFQARDALLAAAAALPAGSPPGRPANAQARYLNAAGVVLAVGRDLLHTHAAADAEGRRQDRSAWAAVIDSPSTSRALLGEIG